MTIFRCDFQVQGDLALSAEAAVIKAATGSGHIIEFRNDPLDEAGNVPSLNFSVIGENYDIDTVSIKFRTLLAEFLDTLAFVTQSRFKILKARRTLDWEPGQGERRMKIFETFDSTYPPEPSLTQDYVETISALEHAGVPEYGRLALKYFRYGLLEESPEDQFLRFWLALEIVAENRKMRDKVAICCNECGEPVKCTACGHEPSRRPMAKDAISQIISTVVGESGPLVSKRLFAARNGIMHGRTVESIEAECEAPMEVIVNRLGQVSWEAIMGSIPLPDEGPTLPFGLRDDLSSKKLVVGMIGGFAHNGDAPHPSEDQLPTAQITVIARADQGAHGGT